MLVVAIDDNFETLKAIKRLLRGHDTYIASDARTALELVRRHLPDVVVIDFILWDLNGLDAIPLIKEASPESMVVVISGVAGNVLEEAEDAGADAYIPKTAISSLPRVIELLSERVQGHG